MQLINRYLEVHDKEYIGGNNKSFMTKALPKSVMERTCFRNKFSKNSTNENRLGYTRQVNFCISLLRKEKNAIFSKLN